MTGKRFFVEPLPSGEPGSETVVRGPAAHHMARVMRLRAGDSVILQDGRGGAREAILAWVGASEVGLTLGRAVFERRERFVPITLALAYAKSDRLDLAVRQAVELGAARLDFFRAARSQYALDASRGRRRLDRWKRIAEEALCQCGWNWLPELQLHDRLETWLETLGNAAESLKLVAMEKRAARDLLETWNRFRSISSLVLAVGPEGGWSDEEAGLFRAAGFHEVGLGPRILRVETAATVFLAAAQMLWGDLVDRGRRDVERFRRS